MYADLRDNVDAASDTVISAVRFRREQVAFPPHFHNCYVFGFVAGGSSTLLTRTAACELEPGSALVMNPGQLHRCAVRSVLDYTSVHVPVPSMRSLSRAAGYGGQLPKFQSLLLTGDAADCIEAALREPEDDQQRSKLLAGFLSGFFPAEAADGWTPGTAEGAAGARAIIDSEYAEPLSLDSLAQRCGLSVSTLRRRFARDTGMSPYEYLLSTRLEHARELLRRGSTAADAAQRTGFCDQSHFTKVFRRYFGLTPGMFMVQQGRMSHEI